MMSSSPSRRTSRRPVRSSSPSRRKTSKRSPSTSTHKNAGATRQSKTHSRPTRQAVSASHNTQKPSSKDELLFTPLGGLEEIGRNMSVFEYKDEIVIIDMGLQFPEEDTPGIDYIIPNVESLIPKKDRIKAIIITHGHYDHIGAVPHLLTALGGNIPIYTQPLSKAIIERRQQDYPNAPKPIIYTVKDRQTVKLSKYFEARFFETLHTIPDSTSVVLKTPVGNIAYSSDLKIDYDMKGNPLDIDVYKDIHKENIHTLFLESTGADRAGHSVPEELVEKNLELLISEAKGRVIVGMFASLLTRIDILIRIAERQGRKVFLSGYSLKTNVNIAQTLGYLRPKKGAILPIEQMRNFKDENILVLSTGAQGESNAQLMRIATGSHKQVSIKKSDTVIFSSSIIPGNEYPIQRLKDNLTRLGARVYQTQHIDVHSSGHGPAADLKKVTEIIKPRFFIPIHGWYFMRSANTRLAQSVGVPESHCLLTDNGHVVSLTKDAVKETGKTVPSDYVMVDGLGVGDVENIVMRDRLALAQAGMITIFTIVDRRTGRLVKNPDIISRGFIHLKNNKDLVEEIRKKVKGIITRIPRFQEVEPDYLKKLMRDQIGQFVYNKTKRRPMILPFIIAV